jgi:hypothetical protein
MASILLTLITHTASPSPNKSPNSRSFWHFVNHLTPFPDFLQLLSSDFVARSNVLSRCNSINSNYSFKQSFYSDLSGNQTVFAHHQTSSCWHFYPVMPTLFCILWIALLQNKMIKPSLLQHVSTTWQSWHQSLLVNPFLRFSSLVWLHRSTLSLLEKCKREHTCKSAQTGPSSNLMKSSPKKEQSIQFHRMIKQVHFHVH